MEGTSERKTHQRKRLRNQLIMSLLFFVVLGGGWFYPLLGYFIPLCMVLGLGIAAFKGRKWCDWYCPRGSFFDALVRHLSPSKEIPKSFKGWPVRIGMLSLLMGMLAVQLVRLWPDFYAIGHFFVILLTITTTVGIFLALSLHQRVWCYLCPIGTLQYGIGKNRYPLYIDAGLCTDCKACATRCPVQIKPYEYKADGLTHVRDGDCLKCGSCAASCPKKALVFDGRQRAV